MLESEEISQGAAALQAFIKPKGSNDTVQKKYQAFLSIRCSIYHWAG
jgi:hypothetical protein